jgi:hypothetical protein
MASATLASAAIFESGAKTLAHDSNLHDTSMANTKKCVSILQMTTILKSCADELDQTSAEIASSRAARRYSREGAHCSLCSLVGGLAPHLRGFNPDHRHLVTQVLSAPCMRTALATGRATCRDFAISSHTTHRLTRHKRAQSWDVMCQNQPPRHHGTRSSIGKIVGARGQIWQRSSPSGTTRWEFRT